MASVANYLSQSTSLDALDLPNGDRGRFLFGREKAQKAHNVCAVGESKAMKIIFGSILLVLASLTSIHAQTAGAAISGSIKDPQGANVPGATVRLYGRDRSFSLVTATDAGGAYSFKNLASGE